MSTPVAALSEVPLFAELSKRDAKRLASSMSERTVLRGDAVVTEGTGGIGFFVILEGRASVTRGGVQRRMLEPGDSFGELSVIDGGTRTATVTAEEDLRLAYLSRSAFRPFVKDHPDVAWALLLALAKLVRASQEQAVEVAH